MFGPNRIQTHSYKCEGVEEENTGGGSTPAPGQADLEIMRKFLTVGQSLKTRKPAVHGAGVPSQAGQDGKPQGLPTGQLVGVASCISWHGVARSHGQAHGVAICLGLCMGMHGALQADGSWSFD